MSRCLPTPAALPYISMATSAMAPNHCAAASPKSVAGAWWWVCSRRGWLPWLGRRTKMHQKIERGTGPWCPIPFRKIETVVVVDDLIELI
jgi:hypothetical protein